MTKETRLMLATNIQVHTKRFCQRQAEAWRELLELSGEDKEIYKTRKLVMEAFQARVKEYPYL